MKENEINHITFFNNLRHELIYLATQSAINHKSEGGFYYSLSTLFDYSSPDSPYSERSKSRIHVKYGADFERYSSNLRSIQEGGTIGCLSFHLSRPCTLLETIKIILKISNPMESEGISDFLVYLLSSHLKYSSLQKEMFNCFNIEFIVEGNPFRELHLGQRSQETRIRLRRGDRIKFNLRSSTTKKDYVLGLYLDSIPYIHNYQNILTKIWLYIEKGQEYIQFPLSPEYSLTKEVGIVGDNSNILYDKETLLKSQDMLNLLEMVRGNEIYLMDLPFKEKD